jgi:hypothetical protein
MTIQRIGFGRPTEVTNPGDDSRSFLFPFSVIDSALVGTPEEARCTTQHELIVTATRSRLAAWKLGEDALVRVLFEIGRRELAKEVAAGRVLPKHTFRITTMTHSAFCPFAPARIPSPTDYVIEVQDERRIGFR